MISSRIERMLRWARSNSLWYYVIGSGCCAEEISSASGARYDLERFGCVAESDPAHADLLIVAGVVNQKAASHIRAAYDAMATPRYVMAVGSCCATGSAFAGEGGAALSGGISKVIPVDVYVPGCPPRPEAIMEGLIRLQERIQGDGGTGRKKA